MQSASFAILSGAELVGRAERLRERRGCSLLMINWVVTGRGRRDLMVCTSEVGERCAGIEERSAHALVVLVIFHKGW